MSKRLPAGHPLLAAARPFGVEAIVEVTIPIDPSDVPDILQLPTARHIERHVFHHMFFGFQPLDSTAALGYPGDTYASPSTIQLRLSNGWQVWHRIPYRGQNLKLLPQHPHLPDHLATWLVPSNVVTWRKIRYITGQCRSHWNNSSTDQLLQIWTSTIAYTPDQLALLRQTVALVKPQIYDSLTTDAVATMLCLGNKLASSESAVPIPPVSSPIAGPADPVLPSQPPLVPRIPTPPEAMPRSPTPVPAVGSPLRPPVELPATPTPPPVIAKPPTAEPVVHAVATGSALPSTSTIALPQPPSGMNGPISEGAQLHSDGAASNPAIADTAISPTLENTSPRLAHTSALPPRHITLADGTPLALPWYTTDDTDPDVRMVRFLANGRDAALPQPTANANPALFHCLPMVHRIVLPEQMGEADRQRIAAEISVCLSRSQCVVVSPWRPRPEHEFKWSRAHLGFLASGLPEDDPGALRSVHCWQSSLTRQRTRDSDEPDLYVNGTMADFIRTVENMDDCVNMLDLPTSKVEIPWMIERIADDRHAAESTRYTRTPEFIQHDFLAQHSWVLLSGRGFYTYGHMDGSGVGTWLSPTTGAKLVGLLRPRVSDGPQATLSPQDVFEQHKMIAALTHEYSKTPDHIPGLAETYRLWLKPLDVFIQPPGQFHHVYTTEDSITAGGHFFTFNTMHLTEWARRCIHDTGGQGTNAYHSATVRQLSLMVIALQQKAPTQVLKRPFLSLARMVLENSAGSMADHVADDPAQKTRRRKPYAGTRTRRKTPKEREKEAQWAETARDQTAAREIVLAVLAANGLSVEDLTPQTTQEQTQKNHSPPPAPHFPDDLPYYAPGDEYLTVPQTK